jgi:hypothetical protein
MRQNYFEIESFSQTRHGQNIAEQIPEWDAYGHKGTLTRADIHEIIDAMHTNIMDGNKDDILLLWLSKKMDELHEMEHPKLSE